MVCNISWKDGQDDGRGGCKSDIKVRKGKVRKCERHCIKPTAEHVLLVRLSARSMKIE